MLTTPNKRVRRKCFWWGVVVAAAALWQAYSALDSYHTGKPIQTLHYVDMEWWEEAGLAVLTLLLGLCLFAVSFGWMKLRGEWHGPE